MQSRCWICRRKVDALDDGLMAALLLHLKSTSKAQGCSRQCEELRTSSAVISPASTILVQPLLRGSH